MKKTNDLSTWQKVLQTLSEKEKVVVTLRFGIGGIEPQTLEQVGVQLGVTRERIRQIEAKVLRKLRHRANVFNLKLDDLI